MVTPVTELLARFIAKTSALPAATQFYHLADVAKFLQLQHEIT
jgi:hypothetical protein